MLQTNLRKVTKFKLALLLSISLVFALISFGLIFAYNLYSKVQVSAENSQQSNQVANDASDALEVEVKTIALLGYGGGNHDGGVLTDTLMVAHLDHRTQTITLISVPRDLWVELSAWPDKSQAFKINAAYAVGFDDKNYKGKKPEYLSGHSGGGNLSKQTLSNVLGIHIDNFVSVDFEGFKQVINTLGGVVVTLDQGFTDPWYPISGMEQDTCGLDEVIVSSTKGMDPEEAKQFFSCRFEEVTFPEGNVYLDADTALKFVRSRHSSVMGNDFGRAQRQRLLLVAVSDKVFQLNFLPKIIPTLRGLSDNIKTDLSLKEISKLLAQAGSLKDYQINSVALTTDNLLINSRSNFGAYILIPKSGEGDYSQIHEWVQKQIQTEAHQ